MTHAELVACAVAWLRRGVPIGEWCGRCAPVYAEIVTAANETPDVIGWRLGHSIVVECKASRSDFLADRRKPHMTSATSGMGRRRYYLAPANLIDEAEVPAWCGLAVPRGRGVLVVKEAPVREIDEGAAARECIVLASAARRHALGVPFDERTGRFQTVAAREAIAIVSPSTP